MNSSEVNPYLTSYSIDYGDGDTSLERVPYVHESVGNDINHTVLDGETLQSISDKYYGDSGYWDIIADVNDITNPISDLVAGMVIMIPDGKEE